MNNTFYRRYGKRLFDLSLTVPTLILLAPFLAIIALIVRVGLGRGVLYKQTRPGLHAKPFVVYKFRTMVDLYDDQGHLLPDKERMTRLGNWLRRLSIDELPQLWNVIRGDISIVGPRPQLMKYVQRCSAEQMRRHEVRPGITGWAQVNGRNSISWEERFMHDVWYVDNKSFWLDLIILWRTVWVVLSQAGISAHGHATMPEFLGTHGPHLAVAGAGINGSVTALTEDDAALLASANEWPRGHEFAAPPRREFVSLGADSRLNHLSADSYDAELRPANSSSRSSLLAANGRHADAVLVDGVLHGPSYMNGHVNPHGTNGHGTNGRAVNGQHVNGGGRNGHANHEESNLVGVESAAVLEANIARKPR
jgi:lipopolysaccharide/colanic/teichoic acid biosynthesis glycosyltransferase